MYHRNAEPLLGGYFSFMFGHTHNIELGSSVGKCIYKELSVSIYTYHHAQKIVQCFKPASNKSRVDNLILFIIRPYSQFRYRFFTYSKSFSTMHITTCFSLALVTFLKLTIVSSSPTPYPQIQINSTLSAPSAQNQTNSTTTTLIVKHIDCVAFKTPYSCDYFCFATFCLGYPDIL